MKKSMWMLAAGAAAVALIARKKKMERNGQMYKSMCKAQKSVNSAWDTASDKIQDGVERAKDMWHDAKNTVKDQAHNLRNDVTDAAHDVRNDAVDNAHDLKESVQ